MLKQLFIALVIGLQSLVLWADDVPAHVSVQLPWKHQFEFAAFYVAKAQGYYQQVGLDVDIREGGPGIDTVDTVVSGKADFGVSTSGLVVDRSKGKPVVALAALMQHSPVALLALHKPNLESVHDLANQPIAVDPHDRDEIEAYLLASGLPKHAINLIEQTDWTLKSLQDGIESAKVVYSINEVFLLRGHEHEYLLLSPRSAGIDLFGNILFTRDGEIAKRAGVVLAFKQATLKGLAYSLTHPEETADLILAHYNTQGKSRAHLLFEAAQIKELTRPDIVEPGYMSAGRWQHVVDVYVRQGKIPANFNLAGFVYDPQSSAIPNWIYFALTILFFGLFVSLVVMRKLKHYNKALAQEVAERKQIQQVLMATEKNYRELVDNANVIIIRLNFDGTITYFNPFAEKFFGYTSQEVLGKHVIGTIIPQRESNTNRDLSELVANILANTSNYHYVENENMTKDGRLVFVSWTNRVLFDSNNEPVALLTVGQDISERRKTEEKIHALAFYDSLTDLPNRRLILDRLHQALLQHQRNGGCGALLFIDLDNFKQLNDTQGHDVGDQLLIQIAQRLQSCVRIDDSVARLGGDEFVVVLDVLDDDMSIAVAEIESIVSTILLRLAEPYMLSNINSHISASIGITLFKDKHDSVNDLLKRADIAMYQAKAAGRNTFRFFDPKMQELAQWRSALEHDLRQSIARQEFLVHYQPQIDMNHKISGVEALVRWQHPVRGMVSPFDFIGLAEETGLIWDIGLQVLHQACAQLAQWQQAPASAHITVSVNISARQFHRADFVEMILAVVAEYGIDANFLLLEITESLLLNNVEEVVYKMNALKRVGIRFSIDDFGTGYSSLAYLKRLPLYELKIDRSFIMDIMRDDSSSAIVTTFINLAHLLELHVVAEGVEDAAQHTFLVDNQCDLIQGFLFSRPVPAAEITQMLEG